MEEASSRTQNVLSAVRTYILEEFLPGEDPSNLEDSTPLISTGLLDSIATLKLASFLEERFGIELDAHEMSSDYLDTTSDIARTVVGKMEGGAG